MQLLVDVFRRSSLEPEVGSYVMKDDGKSTEFTSDSERDSTAASTTITTPGSEPE